MYLKIMNGLSKELVHLLEETVAHAELLGLTTDETHYLLGNTLAMQGEFGESVKAYDKAIEINDEKPEYFHNKQSSLIRCYRQKAYDDAKTKVMAGWFFEQKLKKNMSRGNSLEDAKVFCLKLEDVGWSIDEEYTKRLRESYSILINPYLTIIEKFPSYEKVFLSLANTYVQMGDIEESVESYHNFIQAYEKGKFTFNPIVGGTLINIVSADSELETIVSTSINYLNNNFKEQCLKAFRKALETYFWFNYAEHNRAYVNEKALFQPYLKLIDKENRDPEILVNLPDDIKQKIYLNWFQEKIDSSDFLFWQAYSQGGYESVKGQDKFSTCLDHSRLSIIYSEIPKWLPEKLKTGISSYRYEEYLVWGKKQMTTLEGEFWQVYGQGGYELVKGQVKFEQYLKCVAHGTGDFFSPSWIPVDVREKIDIHKEREKLQTEKK